MNDQCFYRLVNANHHANSFEDCSRFKHRRFPIERGSLVSIRKARPHDAVAIWQVLKAAVTPLIGQTYTRAEIESWIADESPWNLTYHLAIGRTVFVAESQRRIVGFARASPSELEALYVHPADAGQRIGELLLRAVEQSALDRRIKVLTLDAALDAVPFYQYAGYDVLGPSMPLFDNGVALPCIRMQKTLALACREQTGQHETWVPAMEREDARHEFHHRWATVTATENAGVGL